MTFCTSYLAENEMELEKILGERADVHDSLMKKENIAATLELDRKKLQDDLKKVRQGKIYMIICVLLF